MRTRSFIGLIFLVIILMIVSIPALLVPTAAGVERVGVALGAFPDAEAKAKKDAAEDAASSAEPPEAALVLKGHTLTADGDLRDTATPAERASNQHGRLAEGDTRTLLPGQLSDQDAYSRPPISAENGMLLDSTGCPTFDENTDVAAMFADAKVQKAYVAKAAKADDPKACTALLDARAAADAKLPETLLPGDRRQASQMIRTDSDRMLIDLYRLGLYDTFFGSTDTSKQATKIRDSLATG